MAYAAPHNEMSSGYVYNDAGLRQFATRGSGEYWHYQYDAMGQVVSAQKHLPNKTAIPGFGYAYAYDTIGNRLSAGRDGDASRLQAYFSETGASGSPGANNLNQYGSRSVPRKLSVVGKAHGNAIVTVEGNTTTRTGDYFQGIVDYSGEANPDDRRYESIDVQGIYAGQGAGGTDAVAEESADAYLPPNPEDFTYDDDGNLTADSRCTYTWNGENRLIQMETSSEAADVGVPRQKLEFAYDYQGRRISKKVFTDHGGGYGPDPDYEQRFVYDGWNVVARIDATTLDPEQTYVWGTDLSGTLQGAGGVGGLLLITDYSSGTTNLYPQYDGNGNVLAVVDAASGGRTATYEYGPFGNAVQKTGPAVELNPFGFSTKYADGESGLLYYGYRYYSASSGRWLNRDPIGELGGWNLHGFLQNSSPSGVDFLGLMVEEQLTVKYSYLAQTRIDTILGANEIASDVFPVHDFGGVTSSWEINAKFRGKVRVTQRNYLEIGETEFDPPQPYERGVISGGMSICILPGIRGDDLWKKRDESPLQAKRTEPDPLNCVGCKYSFVRFSYEYSDPHLTSTIPSEVRSALFSRIGNHMLERVVEVGLTAHSQDPCSTTDHY